MATYNLKAGYTLTLTTDTLTDADYQLVGDVNTEGAPVNIGINTAVVLGPFTNDRVYKTILRGDGITAAIAFASISSDEAAIALKAPLASPTFTGVPILPVGFKIGAVVNTTTGTELNYVHGVTSAIQTQLAGRALVGATVIAPIANDASGTVIATAVNGIITALIAAGILSIS